MSPLLLRDERGSVAEYGRNLITYGLTRGTGGNISVLNRESGLFAISPSGMDYFKTTPEDVVVMDLEGQVAEGKRKPSSEADMHRLLYRERKDIAAVVHTHSPFATALACTKEAQADKSAVSFAGGQARCFVCGGLAAVHYLAALAGESLRCTPYAPFGTEKLALLACEAMKDRYAVLLGNHGLLAAGADIAHAFSVAEGIEFACQVYFYAKSMGTPAPLSEDDLSTARERFRTYGQNNE